MDVGETEAKGSGLGLWTGLDNLSDSATQDDKREGEEARLDGKQPIIGSLGECMADRASPSILVPWLDEN